MSEDTNTPAVESTTPTVAFTVERNGASRNIVHAIYTREPRKGQVYLKPEEVTPETLDAGIVWYGAQMICDIINAKTAQLSQNITDQATSEEDGKLDEILAKQYFAEFSTRGETKADLEKRKDALVLEMIAASAQGDTAKVMALGEQIKSIVNVIASKKRERSNDESPAAPAN